MATEKNISNLVINKVENQEVYDYMVTNNLINEDEEVKEARHSIFDINERYTE